MQIYDTSFPQNGAGHLVLKNGSSKPVKWEIEVLGDRSIANGCIRGDAEHLRAAAADGCAVLRLTADTSAAVTIDDHHGRAASFTALLTSSQRAAFRAQTIVGSTPI